MSVAVAVEGAECKALVFECGVSECGESEFGAERVLEGCGCSDRGGDEGHWWRSEFVDARRWRAKTVPCAG